MTPLSHHEILELIEPFSRRGRQPDLARSQRLERRLVFQPLLHSAPDLVETLMLENPAPGRWRLTRTLRHPAGLEATLQAEGEAPGALLAQIDAVACTGQMQQGDGFVLALHQRLAPDGKTTTTQATLQVDGLLLALRVPAVSGIAADVTVTAPAGDMPWLPDDLLAVLGWHWSRLLRTQAGWRCTLLLRGPADAEPRLLAAARHLARTLAEPPALFHTRLARRRWGVTLRRAVPALVCIGLIGGAAAVPQLGLAPNSVFRMLIFNAPPLLLVAFFAMREMPQIEIPPLPRVPRATGWRHAGEAAR